MYSKFELFKMYCDFFKCTVNSFKCTVNLNFKRKWKKKDRFLTKCTANVNFQRFLKILLLMILDAINRISFGNCRRSKGFQVNYRPGQLWKTWFCQYPLKVQICCTFYVEVFLRTHKFNHSMMIQNYCFYLYSHFANFENMHGYLLFSIWVFIGTDWAIRHAVCVWCRYVGVWMYVSQKMRHNFGSQLHYSHGTEDSAHNGPRGLGTLHCWRKLTKCSALECPFTLVLQAMSKVVQTICAQIFLNI